MPRWNGSRTWRLAVPSSAELVFRTDARGREPGVVYAHGGAPDPDAFLADALAMVRQGAVAILPDIPITMTGDVKTDMRLRRRGP